MQDFRSPARDILFALNDIAGFADVAALPDFAEATPDLVEAVVSEAARLADEVIAPLNASGDREKACWSPEGVRLPKGFPEAWRTLSDGGWVGLSFPPEFGGQGLPESLFSVFAELVPAASIGFAQTLTLTVGAIEALLAHGSEEITSRFVPKLVSGQWAGTMNLTEPQAGSDVGALKTRAVRMPDGTYRIKGQKIFITSGEHDLTENIVHLVLARVDGAPEGTAGISLFVVPRILVNDDGSLGTANDVKCASIEHKLGLHASATCVMVYGDRDDCIGYLVGEENRGMAAMFTMMNAARLHVGMQGLGCAERAYQIALAYACERVQGVPVGAGKGEPLPIIEHADVRRMLLGMKAKIEASRAICYRAATAIDLSRHHPDADTRKREQGVIDLLTPLAKAYSSDIGSEVASEAIQVLGGMGFIEEYGVAQIYRDVRITAIYEGTNGIQAWDLANRKLKMAGGALWRDMLAEIRAFARNLDDPRLRPFEAPLLAAVEASCAAADWFMEQHRENPRAVAAGAVPFQRLFSETVGAYLLARGAAAAARRLAEGDAERDYLEARIVVAQFFAEKLLPLSIAQLEPIRGGDALLYALSPAQLGLPA